MYKNLFCLFLVVFSINGFSQTNFQRILDYANFESPGMKYDTQGNLLLCTNPNTINSDKFSVVKFDSTGNILWGKKYYNTNNTYLKLTDFQLTPDSSYVFSGRISHTPSSISFIMKSDNAGNIIWAKSIADTGYNSYSFNYDPQIKCTADSGYITIDPITNNVTAQAHMRVLKFDSNGNVMWNKVYGSTNNVSG